MYPVYIAPHLEMCIRILFFRLTFSEYIKIVVQIEVI